MKKLVLLLNGHLGLKVLRYVLIQNEIEIVGIVINAVKKRSSTYLSELNSLLSEVNLELPIISFDDNELSKRHIKKILQASDFGVSVLFGHVLPKSLLESIRCELINLHHSLLPIGRGANPISWAIIEQQKQGATIHLIDSGLDTGEVLVQREIKTNIGMNAGQIYDLAMTELIAQFEEIFMSWIESKMKPFNQVGLVSNPRKAAELESLRVISANDHGSFEDFVRRIQALTFSDGRAPLFRDKSDRLWKIQFALSPQVDHE